MTEKINMYSSTTYSDPDFPEVSEIMKSVFEYVKHFHNNEWPQDDWFCIGKSEDIDVNIWDNDGKNWVTIYLCQEWNFGVGINPALFKRDGSAIMEKADPGESIKGHDSSYIDGESLAQKEKLVKKTMVFRPDRDYIINILSGAIEQGIGYWSVCRRYDPKTGEAEIQVMQEDGVLAKNKIFLNPGWILNEWNRIIYHPELQYITDWEDLDASDYDNIIQVLAFGKLIYG